MVYTLGHPVYPALPVLPACSPLALPMPFFVTPSALLAASAAPATATPAAAPASRAGGLSRGMGGREGKEGDDETRLMKQLAFRMLGCIHLTASEFTRSQRISLVSVVGSILLFGGLSWMHPDGRRSLSQRPSPGGLTWVASCTRRLSSHWVAAVSCCAHASTRSKSPRQGASLSKERSHPHHRFSPPSPLPLSQSSALSLMTSCELMQGRISSETRHHCGAATCGWSSKTLSAHPRVRRLKLSSCFTSSSPSQGLRPVFCCRYVHVAIAL